MGGDEFVAFAMDKSAEEMRALIHKLVQEAVSYTHLDVYKRQGCGCLPE